MALITASVSTSHCSATLWRRPVSIDRSERRTTTSGWIPIERSSRTECWAGFVLSSPDAAM